MYTQHLDHSGWRTRCNDQLTIVPTDQPTGNHSNLSTQTQRNIATSQQSYQSPDRR